MKKKAISIFLAMVILLSCFAFSFSVFGQTQALILDTKMTNVIDGSEDMGWYTYTPEASGTYSFLSYNVPASEAYLFIKEVNSETGSKTYVQLAYSNSDDDYEANDHNSRQFCLTYHLDEGTTYYFAAGWYLGSRTDGTMTVMLRCDSYDKTDIDYIEATCSAELDAYVDGSWLTDSNGTRYFYYNITKLTTNTTVTVYYTDGTSTTVTGADTVDGNTIVYSHTQSTDHWYTASDASYTSNTMTVSVLGHTDTYEVTINVAAMYSVKGLVEDLNGNPIENARIMYNSAQIASTSSDGTFSKSLTAGYYNCTIEGDNALSRDVVIIVGASSNDFTSSPITLYNCDYVKDGIINAKDYSYIIKNIDSDSLDDEKTQFANSIHCTSDSYSNLILITG